MASAIKPRFIVFATVAILVGITGSFALVRALVPTADERRIAQGEEASESMRLNGYWAWVAVKDLGFQAPRGWSQLHKPQPTDPWGTEFQMVIIEQPIEDVPEEVTRGYEFDVPSESPGWFIAVSSAGPDTNFGTVDDLLYWRANSSEDGMLIGQSVNFEAEAWPESFDPW